MTILVEGSFHTCFLLAPLLYVNIFHQNSTNLIVTSIGFQFGYNFVTVMLHPKKGKRANVIA
ncbi:hypothetical protein COK86_23380 [Bacillus cereus]|uniref:Uncharacterized protein n=1 Tax=Bacillus cereus TaxID=1396 RepID=A0A2B3TV12_BACCE|nr:hypothetical protein COK86_23380 [Bacillus cereus]